ncbi:zinc-binding dehydrogenase [Streptomyces niveiscabiei]|uniref:zinc-binding dehydrogenase n=1 Tax=Streptomyces niveiscabiei TaxID=164115 RepID=UPI000A5510E4|nr:zinc-binding dehydrogenase [Streptomyces niveiscabiei]
MPDGRGLRGRVVVGGGLYGIGADYLVAGPRPPAAAPRRGGRHGRRRAVGRGGYLTVYLALTELAGFRPGGAVLAPGSGGSVGQGGVEIARHLGAALAVTTATSTAKAELGRAAGYEVVDLTRESLRDGVARLTGGRGVDVVLDGEVTGQALGVLARGGTLVGIGCSAGTHAGVDITDLIWKAAHIHGFSFSLFSLAQVDSANTVLLDLLAREAITPLVDRVFPLERAARAQRRLIEGGPFGRVLLGL